MLVNKFSGHSWLRSINAYSNYSSVVPIKHQVGIDHIIISIKNVCSAFLSYKPALYLYRTELHSEKLTRHLIRILIEKYYLVPNSIQESRPTTRKPQEKRWYIVMFMCRTIKIMYRSKRPSYLSHMVEWVLYYWIISGLWDICRSRFLIGALRCPVVDNVKTCSHQNVRQQTKSICTIYYIRTSNYS